MTQTALAIIEDIRLTTVSTSAETIQKFQLSIPSIDFCMKMPVEELHRDLQDSLVFLAGTTACFEAAKNLVAAAKRRMQAGELVGGCSNFTGVGGYIDMYLRRDGQSLEAAQRASYRLLDGLQISEKFDGSKAKLEKKRKANEKAKRIQDKKDAREKDKAARLKLDEAAEKAKSIKDKSYIETLEKELDELKKSATQAEVTATHIPVKDVPKSPVNSDVAAADARDLDTSILILQKIVFAVDDRKREIAIKRAIKFLKYKNAFVETSEEAL